MADRMLSDYEPLRAQGDSTFLSADARTAHAAEYAAYQLGQINRKLDRLIYVLEAIEARSEAED
jgi:hypothetical protein